MMKVFAPSAAIVAICIVALTFESYWQYVTSVTITSIVMGLGLIVLVGFARCISLASGAMIAIGAYGAAVLLAAGTPYLLAIVAGTLLGGLGGFVLGIPSVRFRSHNLAMVTLVFQAVVILLMREWKSLTGGAEGLHVANPVIFGTTISTDFGYLMLIGAAAVLFLPFVCLLLLGAFGKNLRAIASNEVGARAFGISIESHLVAAFIVSSAALAFAGALNAPRQRIIDPDSYGIMLSLFTLAGPIIGGLSSLWGGIIGGALMRLLPEVLRPVADYTELFLAGLVVVTVIFMPKGIIGLLQGLVRSGGGSKEPEAERAPSPPSHGVVAQLPSAACRNGSAAALTIRDVCVDYGAVRAVNRVSIEVAAGTIFGLMGPNGAGKTTLFNAISGFIVPGSGEIQIFGKELVGTPIHRRIEHGITRTFQQVAIFPTLTCRDNVIAGLGRNRIAAVLRRSFDEAWGSESSWEEQRLAEEALAAVGLDDMATTLAGALSLGNQRRLEIARAIVSRPKLILLDEPVSGVSSEEIERIAALLRRINKELGVTMVVVEHNIGFLSSLSDSLVVMVRGGIIASGSPQEVVHAEAVRDAYFGEARSA
jgi:ABC-type branched-subunit amino acid transport system ATPase component/ABC-type branched-subunit amino acid transport system permease subunit